MTTTGTYDFAPNLSDVVLNAFSRIGFKPAQLLTEHLQRAAFEANLTLVKMSNHQPNLWTSKLISIPLVGGTATYDLPIQTVSILAAYMTVATGITSHDRTLGPISTVEWAGISQKSKSGTPTTFWFDRQITPRLTLWQVPDSAATYTLWLQTVRQVQDASLPNGMGLDLPYRAYDAFTADLAHRLSRHYAQPLEQARKADAKDSWMEFENEDQENVPMYIIPGLSAYRGG